MTTNNHKRSISALTYIKLGLLLFWAFWFSVAFSSNVTDFLMALGIMDKIAFHSGNYHALENVLSIYQWSHSLLNTLFTLDMTAQGLSALLFFVAAVSFYKHNNSWQMIHLAFMISMLLWAMFLIMEEIFIAYSFEATHIRLIVFELLTLMALHTLPQDDHR